MIDIDRIDERLNLAVTEVVVTPAPARVAKPKAARRRPGPPPAARPAPAAAPPPPAPAAHPVAGRTTRKAVRPGAALSVPELLELGLVEEAGAAVARATDRRDAVAWATMRALLDGRRDAVTAGIEELRKVAEATSDPDAAWCYWVQRFWAAVEWGSHEERLDVLDHCRTRAYRYDELEWWGNLSLLLAVMGNSDESSRAFDEAVPLLAGAVRNGPWLDVLTNLIEAAALFGDAERVAAAGRSLRWPEDRMVVVGAAVVCKGSVERYRALVHAAAGRWGKAEDCFRRAESMHRSIGAGPLLRRTLQQASGSLAAA